ncbi:MAG: gamma-glutamyltransferase family protein [Actinomycetota bacterium]|nr:gamma-glutamyltransferase family protein [Actinomycetota bacterium]
MDAPTTTPWPTTYSAGGLVATVDHLASAAGAQLLAAGGSAADAAVAASAVLAVTSPHYCGIGGDLFVLVHDAAGPPTVLDAAGRAGSGADPGRLRDAGHTSMPVRGDVAAAPVPGCVDGWLALHERHGRRPFAEVLAPAVRLAAEGFPTAPILSFMLHTLEVTDGCDELTSVRPEPGERLVRPELAATLAAIAEHGRDGFYGGVFGRALVELGAGEYTDEDLAESQARWRDPLGLRVWGHDLWTPPPTSQGYLALTAARIAELCGLGPDDHPDPSDAAWVHLLVEASRLAGYDRKEVLFDGADGAALLDDSQLRTRAARFDPEALSGARSPDTGGGTMYLCAVDAAGMGVSLIQSNAKDFGCHVAVPGTGVLLHNRGIGFTLEAGHPAEYGPRRRPPHTLAPALITRPDGTLRAVLGTMGGDSQPQVVLQMAARLLVEGREAGEIIDAPRVVLAPAAGTEGTGFDTWADVDSQVVRIEAHAPDDWSPGLRRRGHEVEVAGVDPAGFGHAQLIEVRDDGMLAGAADPRSMSGAAVAAP